MILVLYYFFANGAGKIKIAGAANHMEVTISVFNLGAIQNASGANWFRSRKVALRHIVFYPL